MDVLIFQHILSFLAPSYLQALILVSFPGLSSSLFFFFFWHSSFIFWNHTQSSAWQDWKIWYKLKILLILKLQNWNLRWESKQHFDDSTQVTRSVPAHCILWCLKWTLGTVHDMFKRYLGFGEMLHKVVLLIIQGQQVDPCGLLPVWLVTLSWNNVYCYKNGEVHVVCNFEKTKNDKQFQGTDT